MKMSRKRYSTSDIENAIKEHLSGSTIISASEKYGIPYQTLKLKIKKAKTNQKDEKPGPKPILGIQKRNSISSVDPSTRNHSYRNSYFASPSQ